MEPISITDQIVRTVLFIGIAAILLCWLLRPAKVHSGVLQTKLGALIYKSGNSLYDNYGRTFHGVEVTLPKRLPHIYIDGHNTDGVLHGPRFVFSNQSRLSLEGDFDKYFQVYAVSHYHRVVLGILQPNVMAQLVDILAEYDVEIWHDKLRIIANKKVFNEGIEHDICERAVLLTNILAPTIRRWKRSDEEEAGNLQLKFNTDTATKFGRKSVSSSMILSAMLLIPLAATMFALGIYIDAAGEAGSEILYLGSLLLFPGLWLFLPYAKHKGWI